MVAFRTSPAQKASAIALSSASKAGRAGGNVTIRPMVVPASIASSNAASFGFSTGMRRSDFTRSMAAPKAEQVKSRAAAAGTLPSAPVP